MELLIGLAIGLWWAHHRFKQRKRESMLMPVVFHEGLAYWLADGQLVKSPARGLNPDFARASRVELGGALPPAQALEILTALEEAERVSSHE